MSEETEVLGKVKNVLRDTTFYKVKTIALSSTEKKNWIADNYLKNMDIL